MARRNNLESILFGFIFLGGRCAGISTTLTLLGTMLGRWFGAALLLVALIDGTNAGRPPRKREVLYEQYVDRADASNSEVVLNVSTKKLSERNATAP
jgi:hypothetical protein